MELSDLSKLSSDDLSSLEDLVTDVVDALVDYDDEDAAEGFETVVDNYYTLLRELLGGEQPDNVSVDRNYYCGVTVDGAEYDFREEFSQDDTAESEMICEIDSMIDNFDLSVDDIEEALNEKIESDWD